MTVTSAGPGGVFSGKSRASHGDVVEWQLRVPYFQKERAAIAAALDRYAGRAGHIPATEAELTSALREGGVDPAGLLDLWGRPYRFSVWQTQRYVDPVSLAPTSPARPHPAQRPP